MLRLYWIASNAVAGLDVAVFLSFFGRDVTRAPRGAWAVAAVLALAGAAFVVLGTNAIVANAGPASRAGFGARWTVPLLVMTAVLSLAAALALMTSTPPPWVTSNVLAGLDLAFFLAFLWAGRNARAEGGMGVAAVLLLAGLAFVALGANAVASNALALRAGLGRGWPTALLVLFAASTLAMGALLARELHLFR